MINGKYSPLNLNCLGQLLQNTGLRINSTQQGYMGVSTSSSTYTTRGTIYTSTVLDKLADVTSLAYSKIGSASSTTITQSTYDALINMGSTTIPALGNSVPSTFTNSYTGSSTKYGWLRLIAYQAYQEFNINGGSSYSDFLNTFGTCNSYLKTVNTLIDNYNSSTTYLKTTYSTMSDLITSDITGVNLSTLYWGQDLIASGRAINLARIDDFGLPSVLLKTLDENHALTPSVNVALLSVGFNSTDISNIISGNVTKDQEKNLYAAFSIIMENDLVDVCVLLNCQTKNLNTLADLLDPKKIFPNSFESLTMPKYNTVVGLPTNSRTYFKIYLNGQPDTSLTDTLGLRLQSIIPATIAGACDAFSISMMQIKNIKNMNIEKFAQVVTNLENVTGLNTGSENFPINPDIAATAIASIANGSNSDGTYSTCDFFGAMTDLHYDFVSLQSYIISLNTTSLYNIYLQMYTLLAGSGPYEAQLLTYISNANAAIASLNSSNSVIANKINTLYNTFGTNLVKEQNARSLALPTLADLSTSNTDIFGFMDNLNEYAIQTQDNGPSLVLESIADTTTLGGNSLIGSMREIRNSERLGLVGAKLESGVDNSPLVLPKVSGTTTRQNPTNGFTPNNNVADIPIVTGAAMTPGSLAGSPEISLIPTNLSVFTTGIASSVLTPSQALDEVTRCNCSCWDIQ